MAAVWGAPGSWATTLQAEADRVLADPPGELWFLMTPPDGGARRRIHSSQAVDRLKRGWTIGGAFSENEGDGWGVFPPTVDA